MSALLLRLRLHSESVGALQCFKLRIASRIVCPFVCTDAGQFEYGAAGTLGCPSGYSAIADEPDCIAAADFFGIPYAGMGFSTSYPKACYFKIKENQFWGAAGATCIGTGQNCGSANVNAKMVCAVSTGPLRRLAVRACARTHTHCLVAQSHHRRLHR